MDKRSYIVYNSSPRPLKIYELQLELPPGTFNLFDIQPNLTYEQIHKSVTKGTLGALFDNHTCYPILAGHYKTITNDVIIKDPSPVAIFPNRAKFSPTIELEQNVFDSQEEDDLFKDDEIIPARQLEREIKQNTINDTETVAATFKQTTIKQPQNDKYIPIVKDVVQSLEEQNKIKNDLTMGYETCHGRTASGKRCLRAVKMKEKYCGIHMNQKP